MFPHLYVDLTSVECCYRWRVLFCILKKTRKNDQHDHHFQHFASSYVLIWQLLLWSVVGGRSLFFILKRPGKKSPFYAYCRQLRLNLTTAAALECCWWEIPALTRLADGGMTREPMQCIFSSFPFFSSSSPSSQPTSQTLESHSVWLSVFNISASFISKQGKQTLSGNQRMLSDPRVPVSNKTNNPKLTLRDKVVRNPAILGEGRMFI